MRTVSLRRMLGRFGRRGQASPSLRQLITGFQVSQAIYVAAELGLADQLKDGPMDPGALAAAVGAHIPSLKRLLKVLAAVGLFRRESGGIALTPLGARLRSDVPGSMRPYALFHGREPYRAFGELLHTIRTGETAFNHVYGMPFFDYFAQHPAVGEVYNEVLNRFEARPDDLAGIIDTADLGGVKTLVDVGGGLGAMITAALKRHPSMRSILFDLPPVIEQARPHLERWGVAERCQLIGGDFFTSVPAGGDTYLLSNVISEWDDDQARMILRNCRRAMTAGGRLLVVDRVVAGAAAPAAVFSDLTMLGLTGGRTRTGTEYQRLLDAAGFQVTRVTPTGLGAHHSVIDSRPGE